MTPFYITTQFLKFSNEIQRLFSHRNSQKTDFGFHSSKATERCYHLASLVSNPPISTTLIDHQDVIIINHQDVLIINHQDMLIINHLDVLVANYIKCVLGYIAIL